MFTLFPIRGFYLLLVYLLFSFDSFLYTLYSSCLLGMWFADIFCSVFPVSFILFSGTSAKILIVMSFNLLKFPLTNHVSPIIKNFCMALDPEFSPMSFFYHVWHRQMNKQTSNSPRNVWPVYFVGWWTSGLSQNSMAAVPASSCFMHSLPHGWSHH